MSAPTMTDLDRALAFAARMGFDAKAGGTGAMMLAIEQRDMGAAYDYAHRVRGLEYAEMREGWASILRLLERSRAAREAHQKRQQEEARRGADRGA